jgi:hypothetical protein
MKSIRSFFGRSDSSNKSIATDHSGHEHQPGNCNVCNMHLVPLVDNSRNIFTIRTVSVIDCYMYVKRKRGILDIIN